MKVALGKEYEDSISGFKGIAMARAIYLHGCVRILLAPTRLKDDGDFLPDAWFDESQLEKVSKGKVVKAEKSEDEPGGPARPTPPSRIPK